MSPPRTAPPLHDLPGVSLVFNSQVAAMAWDRDFACFGLRDGAVAMLRAHGDGAPALAWNVDGSAVAAAHSGGVAVRERAAPAWELVEGLAGAPARIGFLTNGTPVIAGAAFLRHWRPKDVAGSFAGLRGPAACHPRLKIFAAVDARGQIILRRAGIPDRMVLREPGPAPTLLAFSPDGQALAFAAEDGEAGTMLVPDLLFRAGTQGG